jgi:hypothetical protein
VDGQRILGDYMIFRYAGTYFRAPGDQALDPRESFLRLPGGQLEPLSAGEEGATVEEVMDRGDGEGEGQPEVKKADKKKKKGGGGNKGEHGHRGIGTCLPRGRRAACPPFDKKQQ